MHTSAAGACLAMLSAYSKLFVSACAAVAVIAMIAAVILLIIGFSFAYSLV
ncbi:hypothetical protein OAA76_04455 [Planktotalea frisia]|nr:hypothetical protein [Planktotalea frisia]